MNIRTIQPLFLVTLWKQRDLLRRLTEREILRRYRGSALGLSWSIVTPLAMLAVYTFVFSQVFKARWAGIDESDSLGFALNLFAGLIVYNLLSECVSNAPGLILANSNYVKKVVFPLEVLGGVVLGSALFNALTSLAVLLFFELIAYKRIPPTVMWLPIIWLPLILGSLSCIWLISAAGVFIRDISQVTSVILSMLMFLSPIFYPISALPVRLRPILMLNPIGSTIELSRKALLQCIGPDPLYLIAAIGISFVACELGFRIFIRLKGAFADVI